MNERYHRALKLWQNVHFVFSIASINVQKVDDFTVMLLDLVISGSGPDNG